MCIYVYVLPGHVIVTDQQQVLHQGQEVVLSFGVLHCVGQDVKHFPHITEAKVKAEFMEWMEHFKTNIKYSKHSTVGD